MKVLHVVRRYGPVGGMERYVWELTLELHKLGHTVEVLCERCHGDKPAGIQVTELGEIKPKPRWLSLLRFSARVTNWLQAHPHEGWVIHSNERLNFHHVTTFHGPPFATVRDKPWWKKLSLRVAAQFYMERRELERATFIVPNSEIIRRQLADYYPEYAQKLTAPVVPGVAAMPLRAWHPAPAQGGVVGFIGREWQRKGLALAVEIVKRLRQERPQLELWVVGPQAEDIQHLFAGWQGGYRLLGWRSDNDHLAHINVLLHPARAEPYGMVITEAMAAGLPVVISDHCGAAPQISRVAGTVLPLDAPVAQWSAAVAAQLDRTDAPPRFKRDWSEVALEYEKIYRDIDVARGNG